VAQGQHYLISLKTNQKTLHQTLKTLHQSGQFLSQASDFSDTHNRQVHRRVFVYEVPPHLCEQWAGLKRLIWVERSGNRLGKPFHESIGYISDLELDATEFMHRIQQHWCIENRLHWVRDVTFAEDYARPGGNAPMNWAVLNCWLVTIIRQLGSRTIPQGVRLLSNQVQKVMDILTKGFSLLV
jgi:predicted transposase YbfD/YdcC